MKRPAPQIITSPTREPKHANEDKDTVGQSDVYTHLRTHGDRWRKEGEVDTDKDPAVTADVKLDIIIVLTSSIFDTD